MTKVAKSPEMVTEKRIKLEFIQGVESGEKFTYTSEIVLPKNAPLSQYLIEAGLKIEAGAKAQKKLLESGLKRGGLNFKVGAESFIRLSQRGKNIYESVMFKVNDFSKLPNIGVALAYSLILQTVMIGDVYENWEIIEDFEKRYKAELNQNQDIVNEIKEQNRIKRLEAKEKAEEATK